MALTHFTEAASCCNAQMRDSMLSRVQAQGVTALQPLRSSDILKFLGLVTNGQSHEAQLRVAQAISCTRQKLQSPMCMLLLTGHDKVQSCMSNDIRQLRVFYAKSEPR